MKIIVQKYGFLILLASGVGLFRHSEFNPLAFYFLFAATLLVVFALERVYPYDKEWNSDQADTNHDILYALSTVALGPAVKTLATFISVSIGTHFLFAKTFVAVQPIWLQTTVGLLISGFLPYWYHRISHTKSTFWWKVHSIHHASERMYWLNGFRLHPVNAMLNALLSLMPLLLLGFQEEAVLLVAFINNYVSILNHTNIDFRLGLFNYVFNMNELHRWHHARHAQEANNNFSGGALIVWDLVFVTYYHPHKKITKNDLGLFDESKKTFPFQSIHKQLCYPFCKAQRATTVVLMVMVLSSCQKETNIDQPVRSGLKTGDCGGACRTWMTGNRSRW